MTAELKILGLITARGGSKGIPRKNIKPLLGKPLLQYTAEAALAATRLQRVILSTEDPEIADVGRQCGLDVPFMRPVELAQDSTPSLDVIVHALRWIEEHGGALDAVCLLQPTNPFRTAADIDAAAELYARSGADCLISILPVPHEYNPHWVYFRGDDGYLRLSTGEPQPLPRRQLLPESYHREGSIYISRWDMVVRRHTLFGERVIGYEMDSHRSINIDRPEDWSAAERMLQEGRPCAE